MAADLRVGCSGAGVAVRRPPRPERRCHARGRPGGLRRGRAGRRVRIDVGDAATTEDWGDGDGSVSVDVAAATDPGSVPDVDLVVVFVTSTATATAENRSSMRQDVEAGRETEIERPHGAVVDRAERAVIDVPVTRTLADLVRLTESTGG